MRLHKSQVFLILLISFLTGIFLGHFVNPQLSRILFYSAGIVTVVLATLAWGDRRFLLISGIVIVVVFGIWHFQNSKEKIDENHIAYFNDQGKIVWEGVVVEEPDVREDKINLTVEAKGCNGGKGCRGKVLVTVGRYPEYEYGDKLKITGKLETPFETEEFSYKNYLAKDKIYSTSRFVQVELLEQNKGNTIKSVLLKFKSIFSQKLSQVIPEPQNSLLLGLLVGARRSIPEDLLDKFKTTGVTHIIAISGFNISIITRLLGSFIQRRLGIRASLVISTLIVVGFVIITGAMASVVRAAIMGILVVIAMNVGRASTMVNALIFTGAVMVFINPQILVFDVGFQLSFLATAGLIAFADSFEKIFQKVPEFFEIRSSLAATLSAQIFVLPLLIYYFDQLSIVSPIVNVLILPIIPWAMLFGFLSGVVALVFIPLSFITSWITWALLSYQIKIVEMFAAIPHASVGIFNIPLGLVIFYYIFLLAVVFILARRKLEYKIAKFQSFK
ncbi:MAG: hypothetical protein COT91_04810 [Candidatus Doudnabacteria bacterium CG10_big_fil_rev_8_21_14_0_10_41_10]|uniref:ComEC/Rec2-related protein domain-containing protein n=1 Tax=Candidatus Doudnabacteria bacterium CG10_big_fil_rev_8_21_14_0_10_41_10 TaxID=1974551 RepID=A0A2H0VCJ1_9BACT|nr:MAG: hypothetical protein COT91_04810 [Candidatus Doudnabacteria bacterium CG10_big_fil_rev_8_21_14_0_10_41_10]